MGPTRVSRWRWGCSGVLIDAACARKIREAGIRRVAISIDSADPAVHDAFRGLSGAWKWAVQGIKYSVRTRGSG